MVEAKSHAILEVRSRINVGQQQQQQQQQQQSSRRRRRRRRRSEGGGGANAGHAAGADGQVSQRQPEAYAHGFGTPAAQLATPGFAISVCVCISI